MGSVQFLVRGSQQPWISSRTRVGSILKVQSLSWGRAPVSFSLANRWDSTVGLECNFLGREVEAQPLSSLSLQETLWLCPLQFISPQSLDCFLWWRDRREMKSKRKGSCNLSLCSKPPKRIQTCLAKKWTKPKSHFKLSFLPSLFIARMLRFENNKYHHHRKPQIWIVCMHSQLFTDHPFLLSHFHLR